MSNFQRGYSDGWPDWVPEDVEWIETKQADRKAIRSFWRGACFGALLATGAFAASAAWAQDSADWGGTGCQLVPVEGQAHVFEARCRNIETGGYSFLVAADLTAGGITVRLILEQEPGKIPDAFTIVPPDGYFADPSPMILDEFTRGTIRIYEWAGA